MAVLLLAVVFRPVRTNPASNAPRSMQAGRLAVLGLALYMLHQFEEHGIDLRGDAYAFLGQLCSSLGFADPSACPVPASFITAVNLGTVWGAFGISILAGPRRPALALSAYAIPLINAPIHIVTALRDSAYNPGLFTSIAILLPATVWALRRGLRAGMVGRRDVALIALGGAAAHAVLMGSLMGFLGGWYGNTTLIAIQLANAFVPGLLVLAGQRRMGVSSP